MLKSLKNQIRCYLLRTLLRTVVPEDVLTERKVGSKTLYFLEGKQLVDSELAALREEAKFIQKTRLWHLIGNTLAEQARQKMFEKSLGIEDFMFGKGVLYMSDVQDKIMANLND